MRLIFLFLFALILPQSRGSVTNETTPVCTVLVERSCLWSDEVAIPAFGVPSYVGSFGSCDSVLHCPSRIFDSYKERIETYRAPWIIHPVGSTPSFIEGGYLDVVACISGLLMVSSPNAILRSVVSVSILSFYGQIVLVTVFESPRLERLEIVFPNVTDFNSSGSVVFVGHVIPFVAADFHVSPDDVKPLVSYSNGYFSGSFENRIPARWAAKSDASESTGYFSPTVFARSHMSPSSDFRMNEWGNQIRRRSSFQGGFDGRPYPLTSVSQEGGWTL